MFHKWINEKEHDPEFNDNSVMSVRQWLAIIGIALIPILNIIMLLKWAFSSKEMVPANKVNWARALIIVFTILFIAICIIVVLFQMLWCMHCCCKI